MMKTKTQITRLVHPAEHDLAGFLAGTVTGAARKRIERHIAACDECLAAVIAAHESAGTYPKKISHPERILKMLKKLNPYLILALVSFSLSFVMPRYFIQLLVATLLLGIKWVVDSKTTKMLVMIHEAWKNGGEKEASRILEKIEERSNARF